MTTEPCPTCKGVCCVNKYGNPADHGSALALHSCPKCDNGYRIEHMAAECYEHYCEACHDGTVPKPVWTAEDERAATVVYLRGQAEIAYDNSDAHHALWLAAEAIERKEHRR